MPVLVKNYAWATLTTDLTDTSTIINVSESHGARFPGVQPNVEWFYGTLLDSDGNTEIVKCTSRTTGAFTVERGVDGTVARAFPRGSYFSMRVTAAVLGTFAQDEDMDKARSDTNTVFQSLVTALNDVAK